MAEIEETDDTPSAKPKSSKSDTSYLQGLYFGEIEKSFQESSYYPDSQKKPYNPDPLVEKDYTYGVYDQMLEDEQVSVALQLKKDLVIGSGWHIESKDEDIKEDLESLLQDEVARPLSDILNDIIQAYEYGFSVSEKVFRTLPDGRLTLKDIKPRHPSTWLLHTDVHGNMIKYEQRGMNTSVDIEQNSIIHYVNNPKHQNPYGRSDLFTAFQAWMTKRHVTRFYAIYLENAAGPKPVAKYDRRAPESAVTEIFNIIKNFQTKTAMTIPKEFEVEFLEAKNNGESYIKGINIFNMFIGRALFIPDLLGFSGSETGGGSFSLGKEQIGLFYKHIFRRREVLERIIDQHVIRPMCLYNYGLMEEYPKFKFNPLSDEDASKQAELWIKGVQGTGYTPTLEEVNHFRSLVKFPQSDELEMAPVASPFGAPPNPDSEEKEPEEEEKEEAEQKDSRKDFALKLDSLPGNYKAKVNFKLADQLLKSAISKMQVELEPIVEDIFEDLYSQMQKKKIVQTQNIEKSEKLQLKYLGKMQQVFKKHFRRLHNDGMQMAKTEVRKSDFAANLAHDEFLEFLENETFRFVGDWEYKITTKAKNELTKAIKDGKPLSSVISVMDDEGMALSETALERYARTKSTEVFNRGRMEYFDSTGVVDAYQYSAILDDVTSEICGQLNGLTFPKGEAPIPPLHFNCRSVLIPITRFEEWSADGVTNGGQNVDKFLEKEVSDKGFSVYSDLFNVKEKHTHTAECVKPKIGDVGVTFETVINASEEVTTYSLNNKPFEKVTTTFKPESTQILSCKSERLDNEENI